MTDRLVYALRHSAWPPRLLLLAALLLLASTLTQLGWGLLAKPSISISTTPLGGTLLAMPTVVIPRQPPSSFHLLGSIGASASGVPTAPETQLNLNLVGVIGGKTPEDGLAIIADINGRQDRYAVGQTVGQSGAVLEAVYSDRVLLRFNGRQETLRRFKPSAPTAAPGTPTLGSNPLPPAPVFSASSPGSIPTSDPSNGFIGQTSMGGAQFEAMRQQALSDPAALMSQVQVVPVLENGQLRGVRLSYSGDPAVLNAAGMQSSDVVVAVNGTRIDSIERGMQVVETLKTAGSVSITVLRNGVEVPLPPISLGQ
jgi:general secretion pathway protein C